MSENEIHKRPKRPTKTWKAKPTSARLKIQNESGTNASAVSKKRRKSAPSRGSTRKPVTDADRQSEYQSMGCAYISTMLKIVSMACGETSAEIQRAINPDMAERRAFENLLEKIEKSSDPFSLSVEPSQQQQQEEQRQQQQQQQ
jgi:hypothetical protein